MASISVGDAVQSAKSALRSLYSDDPPEALALEEVEFVDDKKRPVWSVTLGFHRRKSITPVRSSGNMADFFHPPAAQIENRVYKTLLIDANTGDFVKMDMRQVQ